MSTENQSQDFEKLQRLLKLKRHELPPPRFFNDFSGKVTDRIRAGDVGRLESFQDVIGQTPWLQRIWQVLEGKPLVSGAFAAAGCGLMLAGLFLTGKVPNTLPALAGGGNKPEPLPQPSLFATNQVGMPTLASSTNPAVVLPGGSLFGAMPSIQTMQVSGSPMQLAPNKN